MGDEHIAHVGQCHPGFDQTLGYARATIDHVRHVIDNQDIGWIGATEADARARWPASLAL